ncbi:putative molybdopterin biosynthesis related methylmutase domain [Rhodovulum sp. P5]|nr:putative molybdopterin biosynthesis related methylmutase domain [Rhodovulum sp. P5]
MTFDTIVVVDWSAGQRGPRNPSKDAIWLGVARAGVAQEPVYCRTRQTAEVHLEGLIDSERDAGRRMLLTFDFPFGYPRGFARHVTGKSDPFALWDWIATRIEDAPDGKNNRFEVAEEINATFDGLGPFWGKPNEQDWPGIPYRKKGIAYDAIPERRACDMAAQASSSCFQLFFPPTVGGQILMGLPMLARLRRRPGVSVWPFEPVQDAPIVLAEIWPGLIEPAVSTRLSELGDCAIRDREQVRLLSLALARLPSEKLSQMMDGLPREAAEEAWIIGACHKELLTELASIETLTPPRLKNDCFAMPQGVDWVPVDTALARLCAALHPITGTERIDTAAAAGRVLAQAATAQRSNPPAANSAVDGYGFAHAATGAGPQSLPLVPGRAAAGQPFDGVVPAGPRCAS